MWSAPAQSPATRATERAARSANAGRAAAFGGALAEVSGGQRPRTASLRTTAGRQVIAVGPAASSEAIHDDSLARAGVAACANGRPARGSSVAEARTVAQAPPTAHGLGDGGGWY